MSLDSKFQVASEAAESWLNTVAMISHLGQGRGNVDAAMELLMPSKEAGPGYNLLDSYNEHAETLHRMKDKLTALSDARVPVLIERGFVDKPPGTKKKGVFITDAGHEALAFAAGNPPETRGKS